MTDSEINICIAEACGWTEVRESKLVRGSALVGLPPNGEKEDRGMVPAYCSDLNAMAQAEETLNESEQRDYFYRQLVPMFKGREPYTHRHAAFATARQRAEAFLRVKGLWKE